MTFFWIGLFTGIIIGAGGMFAFFVAMAYRDSHHADE